MLDQPMQLRRLVRPKDLPLYVGLRPTQIAKLRREGRFPRAIPLSDDGRAIAFLEDELAEWQRQRIAARETEPISLARRGPYQGDPAKWRASRDAAKTDAPTDPAPTAPAKPRRRAGARRRR